MGVRTDYHVANHGMAPAVRDKPDGGGELPVIEIGTLLNQRFRLEKELGRGGMGAVYSATDEVLQRRVAIKLLKEQSGDDVRKKLRLEAQIAARLLHDYVVRIYDFGQADATYFLVMEEVNGTSYSKRWRHLSLAQRLEILAQVADALDYAHHQGVIHRDVKPANVLLTTGDVPKLSDFGLSMMVEQGDQSGLIRGTPHYMSPEQTRGLQLDHRTDLYSLGVMLYESSTGSVPFAGSSISIMSQHFAASPEPPRSRNQLVSPELEALILSAMAKRPDQRPGSGDALATALREEVKRIRDREIVAAAPTTAVAGRGVEAGSMAGSLGETTSAMTEGLAGSSHQAVNGPVTSPTTLRAPTPISPTSPASESIHIEATTRQSIPGAQPIAIDIHFHGQCRQHRGLTALIRSPLARQMLRIGTGRAGYPFRGRTLSPRALSGLSLERIAPARPVPATAPGTSQR